MKITVLLLITFLMIVINSISIWYKCQIYTMTSFLLYKNGNNLTTHCNLLIHLVKCRYAHLCENIEDYVSLFLNRSLRLTALLLP